MHLPNLNQPAPNFAKPSYFTEIVIPYFTEVVIDNKTIGNKQASLVFPQDQIFVKDKLMSNSIYTMKTETSVQNSQPLYLKLTLYLGIPLFNKPNILHTHTPT